MLCCWSADTGEPRAHRAGDWRKQHNAPSHILLFTPFMINAPYRLLAASLRSPAACVSAAQAGCGGRIRLTAAARSAAGASTPSCGSAPATATRCAAALCARPGRARPMRVVTMCGKCARDERSQRLVRRLTERTAPEGGTWKGPPVLAGVTGGWPRTRGSETTGAAPRKRASAACRAFAEPRRGTTAGDGGGGSLRAPDRP